MIYGWWHACVLQVEPVCGHYFPVLLVSIAGPLEASLWEYRWLWKRGSRVRFLLGLESSYCIVQCFECAMQPNCWHVAFRPSQMCNASECVPSLPRPLHTPPFTSLLRLDQCKPSRHGHVEEILQKEKDLSRLICKSNHVHACYVALRSPFNLKPGPTVNSLSSSGIRGQKLMLKSSDQKTWQASVS